MSIRTLMTMMMASLCAFALEVVLPETPSMFEKTAAEELALHLKKSYGTEISTVSENSASGGMAIFVGNTALAKANGIDCATMGNEDWMLKSLDGKRMLAVGGSPRGVIYSAYELLERVYGVMWLDDFSTVVPKSTLDKWPALSLGGKPDFRLRAIHSYFSNFDKERWLYKSRNRLNYFHDEERGKLFGETMPKYGIFCMHGLPTKACHTYYYYTKDLPPEDEDCFSMNKQGKRVRSTSGSGPGQICLSNPKTLDVFERKLREFIAEDRKVTPDNPPVLYEVSANDNPSECQCPGCRALAEKYQSYGGAVLDFTNRLAEHIAKDYPDIKLQMFAYNTAAKPPVGITARPNVLVRLAQLGTEWTGGYRQSLRSLNHPDNAEALAGLNAWAKIATVSIWDYWVTYCGTAAGVCYEAIADNLRIYHKLGVENFFVEHEYPLEIPFYALRLWLGCRLLNDSSQSLDVLTDKFMAGYYGPAAPVMKELLLYMVKKQSEISGDLGNFSYRNRPDFTNEYFAFYEDRINKALERANTQDYRNHVIKERLVMEYARLRRFKSDSAGDMKAFLQRIKDDSDFVIKNCYNGGFSNSLLKTVSMYEGIETPIPMPTEYDGHKVVHQITWHDTLDYVPVRPLYNDPDAAGGRALKADDNVCGYSGLTFGYYVKGKQKFVQQHGPLPMEEIAQDGKYHFYKVGKVTLDKTGFFHAHRSWTDQWFTDHLYVPGGDNDYIAYISLKCVGPAYVKDSHDKTSAIYSDRVLLVREK